MRVLVTGATGFLGNAVVRELLERGIEVRALVRRTSDTSALDALGVETVVGTLAPEDDAARAALEAVVAEVDAVVHMAGGGRALRPADFFRNNAATTANLAEAVRRRPVRRVVFVSSMAARGPAPTADPRESNVADAPITAYGAAKLEAEATLRALEGVPVTVLRPPGIYGPGDDRHLPLFRAAQRGVVPLPAAGRTASFVYVDDCAEAIALATLDEGHHPEPYYVEDGEARTTHETALLIGRAVGAEPRVLRVPTALLRAAAGLVEASALLRGRPALLTSDKARDMAQPHWVCDGTTARERLGWAPRVGFEEGAERTARDYRERGWL